MNTKLEVELNARKHVLISVEKVNPLPAWLQEGDWYRYIIGRGDSKLEGYKIGSIKDVTEYAETVAETLNERLMTGKSPYATNKKQ